MISLINASNLHVGGGVQVAASFVSEISRAQVDLANMSITISSDVEAALAPEVLSELPVDLITRLDMHGLDSMKGRFRKPLNKYDRVFTVFGPLYRWNPPFKSIVGFAQAWIIFPRNEVYEMLPWLMRIRNRIKFWLQSQFFKRADILVVELEHVKQGLVRELGIAPERIRVVHNCVSAIFSEPEKWQPVSMPDTPNKLRLGFLGRNYFHKNTRIFPEIINALKTNHGVEAKVFVTFTDEEWSACGDEFRAACINVGPLSPMQCPNFYQSLDAVVFPSLLECFSATPLEAMAMGKPLFASDRPFNRDVCGDHVQYFDPLSPESGADEIAQFFKERGPDMQALTAARKHAISFSNPEERARQYLEILNDNDFEGNEKK